MTVVVQRSAFKWSVVVAVSILLTVVFSRILAPGWDWHRVFYPALRDIWQGQFAYAKIEVLTNPPWALLLLLPLGLLPPLLAQSALTVATLLAMFVVMRDYRRFPVSYLLAVLSMPLLALIWVGQLEVFSLLGAWLGYRAVTRRRWEWMAAGLLLMLVKPQETWIIILMLLIGSARQWSRREWIQMAGAVLGVAVLSSLLLGFGWLDRLLGGPSYVNDWQNFALWRGGQQAPVVLIGWAALAVLTVWALRRSGVTRDGIAIGATASNLLSPYLTGPHLIMTLCFGWGQLFARSLSWGILAYLTSLTPLLRITTGNQELNQLDLIFPLVVFVGLLVQVGITSGRQRGRAA